MWKKSSKKKPAVEKVASKSGEELSEKELEQVAGGAGASKGKKATPTESVTFTFSKISVKYDD